MDALRAPARRQELGGRLWCTLCQHEPSRTRESKLSLVLRALHAVHSSLLAQHRTSQQVTASSSATVQCTLHLREFAWRLACSLPDASLLAWRRPQRRSCRPRQRSCYQRCCQAAYARPGPRQPRMRPFSFRRRRCRQWRRAAHCPGKWRWKLYGALAATETAPSAASCSAFTSTNLCWCAIATPLTAAPYFSAILQLAVTLRRTAARLLLPPPPLKYALKRSPDGGGRRVRRLPGAAVPRG